MFQPTVFPREGRSSQPHEPDSKSQPTGSARKGGMVVGGKVVVVIIDANT